MKKKNTRTTTPNLKKHILSCNLENHLYAITPCAPPEKKKHNKHTEVTMVLPVGWTRGRQEKRRGNRGGARLSTGARKFRFSPPPPSACSLSGMPARIYIGGGRRVVNRRARAAQGRVMYFPGKTSIARRASCMRWPRGDGTCRLAYGYMWRWACVGRVGSER